MRLRLIGSSLCVAAALVFSFGCTKESPSGGPGAVAKNAADSATTFKIEVPKGTTGITQGQDHDVSVSVSRGSKFDQEVKLALKAPAGIEVTPDTATVKKGSDEVKVKVHAKDDAKTGKQEVEVTGTPATGEATIVRFTIEVKAKS